MPSHTVTRRSFVQTAAAAALSASAAGAAAQPAAPPAIPLGLDTYSIRDTRWNVFQMLDYAARQKLDMIQATWANFQSTEPAYLEKVKDYAARLGVALEIGYGCICPVSKRWNPKQGDPRTYILTAVRAAKILGAKVIKCYAGNADDRTSAESVAAQIEATAKAIRSVRNELLDAGLRIALENHGDLLARDVKAVIDEAGKDIVGSNLDTGNPVMGAEDPLRALEILGPYVIATHIRDAIVCEHPRGAVAQWVALGDGGIDWKTFVARFAELCPGVPFQLEIITGTTKVVPYLEDEFWKVAPNAPASDLARFVRLARRGGPMPEKIAAALEASPAPASKTPQADKQLAEVERSLEYARKTLGLGIRWKT